MEKAKSIEKALEIVVDLLFFEFTETIEIKDIQKIEYMRKNMTLEIKTKEADYYIYADETLGNTLDGYKNKNKGANMTNKCKQLLALQTLINIVYLEYGVWITIDDIKTIEYVGSIEKNVSGGAHYYNIWLYSNIYKKYKIALVGSIDNMIVNLDLDDWKDE